MSSGIQTQTYHRPAGIRANAVNPDRVRTNLFDMKLVEARAKARGLSPGQYFASNLLREEVLVWRTDGQTDTAVGSTDQTITKQRTVPINLQAWSTSYCWLLAAGLEFVQSVAATNRIAGCSRSGVRTVHHSHQSYRWLLAPGLGYVQSVAAPNRIADCLLQAC